MKAQKLLILFFLLSCSLSYATGGFWKYRTYGNVVTRVSSIFDFEAAHNVEIIGKMASELSEELNYSDTIFLDFRHHSYDKIESHYFVGVDNNWFDYGADTNIYLNYNLLIITQFAYEFDIEKTIQLLEYSIQNKRKIEREQELISKFVDHRYFELKTIDSVDVYEVISANKSALVQELVSNKYYRTTDFEKAEVKCYWQNNSYHFEVLRWQQKDTIVFETDYIYTAQFFQFGAIVFDTDSSFVFVNGNDAGISKKHFIAEKYKCFGRVPVKFVEANRDVFICGLRYFDKNYSSFEEMMEIDNRTLVYLSKKDFLIQFLEKDLEKLIELDNN